MARTATAPAPARRAPARPRRHAPGPGHGEPSRRPQAAPRPRGAVVLDTLLYGRAWIALVFALLVGIVFFNVDLLRMNREIAATAEQSATVKRQNARLRTDLARLGSSERIQRVAAERGLVLPAPGEVRYLRSNPTLDARRAATRMDAGKAAASLPGASVSPAGSAHRPAAAPGSTSVPAASAVQPQQ